MRPLEHTKIVILTDLGTFRAFHLSPEDGDSLAPHQGPANIEERELPTGEWDRDRPGGFPQGKSVGETTAVSSGENTPSFSPLRSKSGFKVTTPKVNS